MKEHTHGGGYGGGMQTEGHTEYRPRGHTYGGAWGHEKTNILRNIHTKGTYTEGHTYEGKNTRTDIHMAGHSYRGDILMKEQTCEGTYARRGIHTEGTYTWRGHAHGGEIHTEGIYTWRGYTHGGDIHMKEQTYGRTYT